MNYLFSDKVKDMQPSAIREIFKSLSDPNMISFAAGNPAAAYVGFEMIIRPALRKMQGYAHFERPSVMAKLSRDVKKKDPRRIFLRGTLYKNDEGEYVVAPAKNQSSGLFGVIQRSNCMAIMPEGLEGCTAGSLVECVLLDVPEEIVL